MAEGEQQIELKFRIFDGTDISHNTYPSSTTVASLKQQLVAQWPRDKPIIPKSINDVKLIHAGKVLENNKTLAESKLFYGDLPSGVITMHVVVQTPVAIKKSGTVADNMRYVPQLKGKRLTDDEVSKLLSLADLDFSFMKKTGGELSVG